MARIKKYPVVTLCGDFKYEHYWSKVESEFRDMGYLVHRVIPINRDIIKNEEKYIQDMTGDIFTYADMNKYLIDLSDLLYVVPCGGPIDESTWSEICYASMVGKTIQGVDEREVEKMVKDHIDSAEMKASRQLDVAHHHGAYFDYKHATSFVYKKQLVLDPWISASAQSEPWAWECHGTPECGVDPFEYYGKRRMARFVEEILLRYYY